MATRFAIIEDNADEREIASLFLTETGKFTCVGAYSSAEEALPHLRRLRPELVLMDIRLPGMSGLECARILKSERPGMTIIILSGLVDGTAVKAALAQRLDGYVTKPFQRTELVQAAQMARSGGMFMSKPAWEVVMKSLDRSGAPAASAVRLTATERSILFMLAEGLPYKGIAERRRISFYTVRTHVHNLYEKLGVHSKTEAINKYFGRPEPPG